MREKQEKTSIKVNKRDTIKSPHDKCAKTPHRWRWRSTWAEKLKGSFRRWGGEIHEALVRHKNRECDNGRDSLAGLRRCLSSIIQEAGRRAWTRGDSLARMCGRVLDTLFIRCLTAIYRRASGGSLDLFTARSSTGYIPAFFRSGSSPAPRPRYTDRVPSRSARSRLVTLGIASVSGRKIETNFSRASPIADRYSWERAESKEARPRNVDRILRPTRNVALPGQLCFANFVFAYIYFFIL